MFGDHYHARLLRSPTELVNAIAYVLGNAAHHFGRAGADPCSSASWQSNDDRIFAFVLEEVAATGDLSARAGTA